MRPEAAEDKAINTNFVSNLRRFMLIVIAGIMSLGFMAAPVAAGGPELGFPAWSFQLNAKDHTVRAGGVRFFQEATLKNATGKNAYVQASLTLDWAGFSMIGDQIKLSTNLAKTNPNRNLWAYRSTYNVFYVYGDLRPGETLTLGVETFSSYDHGLVNNFAKFELMTPYKAGARLDTGKLTLSTGANLPIAMKMTAPNTWLEGEYGEITLQISVPAPATSFTFQIAATCASAYIIWNSNDLAFSAYGTVVNHNIEGYLYQGVPCEEMVITVMGKAADGRVLPPATKKVQILHR